MKRTALGMKSLVAQAERTARSKGQQPSTAHVLLAMLRTDEAVATMLRDEGVRETDLLNALRIVDGEAAGTLERVLERSRVLASRLGHGAPGAAHLLLAMTRDVRSAGHRSLTRMGAGPARLQQRLLERFDGSPQRVAARPYPAPRAPRRAPGRRKKKKTSRRPSARRGRRTEALTVRPDAHPIEYDRARGCAVVENDAARDAQPQALPILAELGRDLTALAAEGVLDPVVGRAREIDALLDILRRRTANSPLLIGPSGVGKTAVAAGLAHRLNDEGAKTRLIEVSVGALVRGTATRGSASERLAKLAAEIEASGEDVVLFIDELHTLAASAELCEELKVRLGGLRCIGATSEAEYRRAIEPDAALARRFSLVPVDEPSEPETQRILRGLSMRYAQHHQVTIDDDALTSATELSARYVPERRLPEKAIGVLDLACARAGRMGAASVGRAEVAAVIAESSRVPVERLLMNDGERLLQLESLLSERVVGHEDVVFSIAESLRKSAAGFRGRGPQGTFLFLGPTGVGKTEMAKAISDVFFPGSPMTRFDMSELSERHAVARLFGAPPGYIGHDSGGQLTEALRRRPYQLVLLDEIEKAHPEVLLSLLPLLDEGRLTDGRGLTVNARETIVVMTSNLGAEAAVRRSIGFSEERPKTAGVLATVRRALPPELFNRIDEPLYFAPLSRENVRQIAARMVERATDAMAAQGVRVRVDDEILDALIDGGGFDPALGARPMARVVGREVEAKLASGLLAGDFGRGDIVRLAVVDGAIAIRRAMPRVRLRTPA
ncbi:MAG: ATP-dependent Clp protease ATP-binding subunit [Myxococcota bacterium]